MGDKFLDKVYDARGSEATRDLYDAWAASYEAEIGDHGYATPGRCATALAKFMPDKSRPILDFGCGTGLSGLSLKLAGFAVIDGLDLSRRMLEQARSKQVYRNLDTIAPGASLAHRPGEYAAIAAVGVIGAGAAPISTFDLLMRGLGAGGKLVFSLNDHALADKSNEARLSEWVDCGEARLLFREHGPHLPGINLKANVYVVEKT